MFSFAIVFLFVLSCLSKAFGAISSTNTLKTYSKFLLYGFLLFSYILLHEATDKVT